MGKWLAKFIEKNSSETPEEESVISVVSPVAGKDRQTCTVSGQVIQLHRMRPTCQEIGHCLNLTVEADCNLFPLRLGWCQERKKA
jgi:hypothetical protein